MKDAPAFFRLVGTSENGLFLCITENDRRIEKSGLLQLSLKGLCCALKIVLLLALAGELCDPAVLILFIWFCCLL